MIEPGFVSKLNDLLLEYPLKIIAGQAEIEGVLEIKVLEMGEVHQKLALSRSEGYGGYFFLQERWPFDVEPPTTDPATSSLNHELAARGARVEALSQGHGTGTLALLVRYGRALEQIADDESGSIGAADWMIDVAKEALGRNDETPVDETPVNEIESLAIAQFEASELVMNMLMFNVSMSVDYETRKARAIEYAMAKAKLAMATANLENAIRNAKREVEG